MSRESFAVKLDEWAELKGKNIRIVADEEHAEAIDFLLRYDAGDAQPVAAKHHRWLRTLALEDFGGVKKLVRKESRLEAVRESGLFDKLNDAHISMGHAGRDKMTEKLGRTTFNVSSRLVNLFLSTCAICDEKRSRPRKGVVVKPIISAGLNSRAQVDLICEKDGEYSYVLDYQDHLTKFVSLRVFMTKRAEEVAYHLIDIFLYFWCTSHSSK